MTKEEYDRKIREGLEQANQQYPAIEAPVTATGNTLSKDTKIADGQRVGLERAEKLYGMNPDEIGSETQDVVRRRRERLDGKDAATTSLRQRRNQKLRTAKASGKSEEEMSQIERSADTDIGNYMFQSQGQALSDYQKLIGNIIAGTSSMEMGFAGLEKSGEKVPVQAPSSGFLGTVICTVMHDEGYMSDEIYAKDIEFGINIRKNDPLVYVGYRAIADPMVIMMEKSKLFTKLVSYPAMAWARNMAGDYNLAGKLITTIGMPLCRLIGMLSQQEVANEKV